jgi:hypothetical protein
MSTTELLPGLGDEPLVVDARIKHGLPYPSDSPKESFASSGGVDLLLARNYGLCMAAARTGCHGPQRCAPG